MPEPWEDLPADAPVIEANVINVLTGIAGQAGLRALPTYAMAQQWHREVYLGTTPPPFPYYAGEVRDSDPQFQDLIGYEVAVGQLRGVPSAQVPAQLQTFEQRAQLVAGRLDADIAVGTNLAALTPQQVFGVLTYCANLHGEWVRIHPFANGNGRTARLWANWAALRYGFPPFIRIKPRPAGTAYGAAAMMSMTGDHRVTVGVFKQMLDSFLASLG